MFEDLPIFFGSLKVMKFWSFILVHNWRRYSCLIPTILLSISQFADMYYTVESIDGIIRNAYIIVLWLNSILRAIQLIIHRFRYEKFMKDLYDVYVEMQKDDDPVIKRLLAETTKSAKKLASINWGLGISAVIGFYLYPAFNSSRVLPFGMYVPVINKYQSPWYETFYVLQIFIIPMGCCMYIPFTNMVVSFIIFGIFMCKVMQHHLRRLKNLTQDQIWKELVWCIRFQVQFLRYVKMVNSLTTYIFLMEYMSLGAMLCALLFLLNLVDTVGQAIIVAAYLVIIFTNLALMYTYANELYYQSFGVAEAAYESDWFDFDLPAQKALLLFISRAQQPCAILIGNVYPVTLEMLQTLVNTSYSYFILLRRLYG